MDRRNKLITISIAAYNVESSLERTLSSLAGNTEVMNRLDIIVVDDGSTDSTAKIADRFSAVYPDSVRVIHKSNGGYGSTVNAAIDEARGLYFKLLDGDDEFDADGLSGLISCIEEGPHDPDIIISPFIYVDRAADKSTERTEQLCDRHMDLQTEPVNLEEANLSDGLMMFEMCVRTEVLRTAGVRMTENCFYTDNEYVMAAELYASDVMRYPWPVYRYSIGVSGQSMSIAGRRLHMDDKVRAARGVCGIYDSYVADKTAASGSIQDGGTEECICGSRKLITDKLLSTMTREIYVGVMIQEDPASCRGILRDWDSELAERWPYIYGITDTSRLVRTVRGSGNILYRILCRKVLRSESARLKETAGNTQTASFISIAEYLAAACMIIQCRTVYMHLQDYGMIVNRTVWVIMMAALAVCVLHCIDENYGLSPDSSIRRKLVFICIGVTVYAAVFLAANPVNYLRVIRCAGAVLMMLVLALCDRKNECTVRILGCFRTLMVIIAGASICFWILISIFKIIPCTGTAYMDWSATGEYAKINSFLGIYFETQWMDFALFPVRNCGIFVEGPMAGAAYSIALLAGYMFEHAKITESRQYIHRRISTCILTLAVLSTFSIICYGFLVAMAFAQLVIKWYSGGPVSVVKKVAAAVLIIAGAVTVVALSVYKLRSPITGTRFNDFVVGYHAWLAHPFFGGGFESLEYLQQFMPEWRSFDTGFSNSPMEILAQGGLYLAVPYVYAFVSPAVNSARNKDLRLFASVIMFAYLFTFIVIPYQYITFFILILLVNESKGRIKGDGSGA